jgi:ribonuclease VapC
LSHVLDASALLALIRREPGADRVTAAMIARPVMATLNMGEVAQRLILMGLPRNDIGALLAAYPLTLVDLDTDLALAAGFAAPVTRALGLSFGDRVCLMLAKRQVWPALTADRDWVKVADALGVQVELIR